MNRSLTICLLLAGIAALSGCASDPRYLLSSARSPNGTTYVYETETGRLVVIRYDAYGQFIESAPLP